MKNHVKGNACCTCAENGWPRRTTPIVDLQSYVHENEEEEEEEENLGWVSVNARIRIWNLRGKIRFVFYLHVTRMIIKFSS